MSKPEIFYERKRNSFGNPIIKRTMRVKQPIHNRDGRVRGYFHQERVNFISGNKLVNGTAKIPVKKHPSMGMKKHLGDKVDLKNIIEKMLLKKTPVKKPTNKKPVKKPTKKKPVKKPVKKPTKKKPVKKPVKKKPVKKPTKKKPVKKKSSNSNKNY